MARNHTLTARRAQGVCGRATSGIPEIPRRERGASAPSRQRRGGQSVSDINAQSRKPPPLRGLTGTRQPVALAAPSLPPPYVQHVWLERLARRLGVDWEEFLQRRFFSLMHPKEIGCRLGYARNHCRRRTGRRMASTAILRNSPRKSIAQK